MNDFDKNSHRKPHHVSVT